MANAPDRADLVDISSVRVDRSLPKRQRIAEFVRQVKDPRHYMCNGFKITATFTEGGPTLEDCLRRIAT